MPYLIWGAVALLCLVVLYVEWRLHQRKRERTIAKGISDRRALRAAGGGDEE